MFAIGGSAPADAANLGTLEKAYLFSKWSAPATGSAPPFTFMGTDGVELILGGACGTTVTGVSDIGPLDFSIDRALTFAAKSNRVNPSEPRPTGARINSEVATWDDAGIVNEGSGDAARNIDFRRAAQVVFNPASGPGVLGHNALIVAEDAAFDPLGLSLCSTASCSDEQSLASGFSLGALFAILSRSDFVARDGTNAAKMDQAYVFLFSEPIDAFTAVTEIGNPGGAKLEVDFIGTGIVLPLPGAVWLFGAGLIALAGCARRKRPASA